ncbi:MAG: leucine--tRNA ligase [Rickettsiales bacterium]|jgi:leucyl-tRNA synthetase|nr:leucine--tRNA ligase [Rickettsiales bacterium]
MTKKYDFGLVESKWQKIWDDEKLYDVRIEKSKPKFYGLIEFPYPSGAGLHVGHPRPFTAMDIIARKRRAQGYNVLFPIGFDAFGLPAEHYAIKTGQHPAKTTRENIANFTKQLKSIGFSFAWGRAVTTTDPSYYKWTQWMFVQMFKAGLAYKGEEEIWWCPSCKIGIANEELENGKCERCGSDVVKKTKPAWMLKMRSYSDKLLDGLKRVDYTENVKKMQEDWIGRSEGAEIDFTFLPTQEILKVFTTRADTIYGATYMVMAPEHPFIDKFRSNIRNWPEVEKYRNEALVKTGMERQQDIKAKTGVRLDGIELYNPVSGARIPVFVADYVLMNYGTGAIMAVPAHDERDWNFAKKFNLPIIPVIKGGNVDKAPYLGDGVHVNSGKPETNAAWLDGLDTKQAAEKIIKYLEDKGIGRRRVNYRMTDWVFSRQRYWGEPIPMVYCQKCGWVPVDEKDLPVVLPEITDYMPTEDGLSPLAKAADWVKTKCPKCGGPAERETDTMPTWAGSSWYYLRYMDAHDEREFASKEALEYWGPVDWYVGGQEHVTRHLLYSRFWHKALYDEGHVPYDEPYAKRSLTGLILAEGGEKMSKSKGNVVNPDDIIREYGADTLRTYEMFIGPFDQAAAWSTESMAGVYRFLCRTHDLADRVSDDEPSKNDRVAIAAAVRDVSERIEQMKFNTAVSALMICLNYMETLAVVPRAMFGTFVQLLAPFAPHLASELWERIGGAGRIDFSPWPSYDEADLAADTMTIVVQVNGKKRAQIEVASGISEDELKKLALGAAKIEAAGAKKIFVVPGRLVNVVT